jgi:hypothetical protein
MPYLPLEWRWKVEGVTGENVMRWIAPDGTDIVVPLPSRMEVESGTLMYSASMPGLRALRERMFDWATVNGDATSGPKSIVVPGINRNNLWTGVPSLLHIDIPVITEKNR